MKQMLKNKLKDQKGFTLIELLAVIVILGIIAAIAIPAIGNVIEKSKEDAKIAEAIQIIDAARLAYTDGATTGTTSTATGGDKLITWTHSKTPAEADLEKYVSKLQDTEFVVTYNITDNVYSISGHEANGGASITEDALANLARN